MSKLNKDILFSLFEELYDSKSLFSCLMVNRLWCETVIPVLWRDPWRYDINDSNKYSLYHVITSYLTDDIKEFLTKQGIQLPLTSHQSLLFDYLSFCKSINVNVIMKITSTTSLDYHQFLLQEEIYSLFIRKCSELKYLDMRSIKHQIFYLPEAWTRLDSLCKLTCETFTDSSYFYGLARICQNIQRLFIINTGPKVNDGIVKLIEVQKNLKYFDWEDDFDELSFFMDPYQKVFMALTKKADTLNHLIILFQFVEDCTHTFLKGILPEFRKLKTLKINGLVLNNEESFKSLVYRDLKIFEINYIKINTVACIIRNSGSNLREILLKSSIYSDFNEDYLLFIRTVYNSCPLVEYLSLLFLSSKENFIEFEKLLKTCQNLKSLLLINVKKRNKVKSNEEKFADGEELLKILIRSAPNNLREIRFFDQFKFSLKNLKVFFEKWRGRVAISIITTDYIYDKKNYVSMINKYKNEGIIKDFRRDNHLSVYY